MIPTTLKMGAIGSNTVFSMPNPGLMMAKKHAQDMFLDSYTGYTVDRPEPHLTETQRIQLVSGTWVRRRW
jgi:hypothetical protein